MPTAHLTSLFRISTIRQKTKGRKHYTVCILQAHIDDVNHLRTLLASNVTFTNSIFIPNYWADDVRERFIRFIESIGFVRESNKVYSFSNDDLVGEVPCYSIDCVSTPLFLYPTPVTFIVRVSLVVGRIEAIAAKSRRSPHLGEKSLKVHAG